MKKYDYSKYKEDEHIVHNWEPLDFEITDDYKYVNDNKIYKFFANIVFLVAYILLKVYCFFMFGFRIKNKKKLLKKDGYVTISNHVHTLDCAMIAIACFPKRVYFPTLESNFKIPLVKHLIKVLYAMPIPKDEGQKKKFYDSLGKVLKKHKIVHMYPEGSLWPYYEEIRSFKYGAFKIAVENNVPIMPIKFVFTKGKGIFIFKRNKCIHAKVLDPIYPNPNLETKKAIEELKNKCQEIMKEG